MSIENKYITVEQYLRKISGIDKEILLVDHNYVKPWNAHPESNRTKPAKLLFMKGLHKPKFLSSASHIDEDVDIESIDEPQVSPFDNQRTRLLSIECERNLKYTSLFGVEEQEKEIDLSILTSRQRKLYQQVMGVFDSERLARLTFSGSLNEPLKRRIAVDKAARSIRQIFGLIFWDMELLGWLHKTILSNSDLPTLSIYVDVLQTLKSKMPNLIDRLLQVCSGSVVGDAVIQVVKKPWDPVLPILNQSKPKKLPGNPVILLCPSGPNHQSVVNHSLRFKAWQSYLSCMCKVINVPLYPETEITPSLDDCLQQILTSIKAKVAELKNHYPNRPLILLGWTIGALIACHIALQEPVDGVICLGFPLTGVNGSRGDLSDPLLDNKVPTLFIVGQNAHMCSSDDIEDFRLRMRAETGLVVLGGSDDLLRMCPSKMKQETVTQAMVDRCLMDEIADFLLQVVIKVPSSSSAATTSSAAVSPKICPTIQEEEIPFEKEDEEWKPPEEEGKRKRRKPREYSPELSPVRKRPRHHIPRQVPIAKARLSPSSSESSSSGSLAHEKPTTSRLVKKTPEKKICRPTTSTWKKRSPIKLVEPICVSEQQSLNIAKMLADKYEEDTISKSIEVKPLLPFSKNILPKKNEPVDVDKAFGSDCSFLPRPLTPPEPEDTISAEETEKAMAELEAMASGSHPNLELPDEIPSIEHSFLPISEIEKETKIIEQPSSSELVTNPIVVSAIPVEPEKSKVTLTLTQNFQTVLSQAKAQPSTTLQSIKTGGISLLTSSSTSPGKSTIITVPSVSAASFLASSPALKGQPAKMIQLLTAKGNTQFSLKNSPLVHQIVAADAVTDSTKQRPSNFSHLSNIIAASGVTLKESSKKPETSSSATLVKLAPEKVPLKNVKCLKVIKSVRASSPPTRFETAEELVEKQLAIQALNKSIGIESHSSLVKESGYSICYAKADGSIVSRSVARPSFSGYTPSPLAAQSPRGRGRGRPPFTSKPYKMFEM